MFVFPSKQFKVLWKGSEKLILKLHQEIYFHQDVIKQFIILMIWFLMNHISIWRKNEISFRGVPWLVQIGAGDSRFLSRYLNF